MSRAAWSPSRAGRSGMTRDQRRSVRRAAHAIARLRYPQEVARLTHAAEVAIAAGEDFNAWLARELCAALTWSSAQNSVGSATQHARNVDTL